MKTQCFVELSEGVSCDCLVLPVFENGLDAALASPLLREEERAALTRLGDQKLVTGKANYFLPAPTAPYEAVLVLGLGKKEAFNSRKYRDAAGKAAATLSGARRRSLVIDLAGTPLSAGPFVEGIALGQYRYDEYRKPPEETPVLVESIAVHLAAGADAASVQAETERAVQLTESVNWARDLGNCPANVLTPTELSERAAAIGRDFGAEVTILGESEMKALGMGCLLAVSQGSDQEAKLICLKYTHPQATKTVALVGKGVTFDSGGISIKPSLKMEDMKFDMCGAAAVLGAMRDILITKPAINVVCVVPASENLPSSGAVKPGDIVTSLSGKTVEIYNTDAEGRLVLSDAMTWTVQNHKPDMMVDLATLTGAVVVALGHHCAGVLTQDDEMADTLIQAGEETDDRVWRLPLWDEHLELMKGKDADLCNIGPGYAGTITGAAFLSPFSEGTRWAHIDIAGMGWKSKASSFFPDMIASGYGVRLLSRWVTDIAEGK